MLPTPPFWPPANQEILDLDPALVPKMRSILSWVSEIVQETSAMMPPGNFSSAEAHSSTPVLPRCATPATFTGSAKGLLGRSRDQPRHRDRIAADVENAAAGDIIGKKPVLGPELPMAKPKLERIVADLADGAGFDQLDDLAVCGCTRYMKASPMKVPALFAA